MKQVSVVLLALLHPIFSAQAALINGNFATPLTGSTPFRQEFMAGLIYAYDQADVPGWDTTDVNGAIEIWRNGAYGFTGYGNQPQWAELNAYSAGTLSQVVTGLVANSSFGFSFAHRGRGSATVPDVLRVRFTDLGADNIVGGANDSLIYTADYSATNVALIYHQVNLGIKPNGNAVLVQFQALSTGSGNISIGTFLTAIALDNNLNSLLPTSAVPEPGTLTLAASALLGLILSRRSRG